MHFAAIFLRLYRLLFFLPQAGKHAMDILISQRPMGLSLRTVIGSKGFGGLLLIFKTRSRWLFRCSGTLCWSNMNHETSSCFVCLTGTIISHISYIIYITYISPISGYFNGGFFFAGCPEKRTCWRYPRTSTILQWIAHRCGKMMAFWSGWECTLTLSGLQWLWFSSMQSGALAVFMWKDCRTVRAYALHSWKSARHGDWQRISVDIEFNDADILAEAFEGMALHVVATT